MDQSKKDESRNRDREEALARRMGAALDQISPRDGGKCPDAELIAAYHERGLGPDEHSRCESHFATCARCRKILLVLAASDVTPLAEKEVARLGELVAAAQAPREAASRTAKLDRQSRWDWRVRWLVPAFSVVAVLAVWFAMRPPWRVTDQNSQGTLVAQAPQSESLPSAENPPVDQFSQQAPAKRLEKDSSVSSATSSATLKDRSADKTESRRRATDALEKNRLDTRATGGLVPNSGMTVENEKKEAVGSNTAAASSQAPAPPRPMAALQTEPQSAMASAQVPQAKSVPAVGGNAPAREKQNVAGQAQADEKVAARAPSSLSPAARDLKTLSRIGAMTANPALIRAPFGSILWRVGNAGHIERSTDAGRTWIFQASPSQEEWLAGAAANEKICWIVGRNGAIARTIDAEHWEKIAPPPMSADAAGKFPDWTGVTASGAEAAMVTSSDGRRYATQDGGKTWRTQ